MKPFSFSAHLLLLITILAGTIATASANSPVLDPTFGNGGRIISDIGLDSFDNTFSLAVQSDGKILIGGNTFSDSFFFGDNDSQRFSITRLNVDGSLDLSFGTGGMTAMRSLRLSSINSLAVQPDGKIIAAGSVLDRSPSGFNRYFFIIRLNSDGSFDNTFGSNGIVELLPDSNLSGICTGVAIQTDGRIVAAGYDFFGTSGSPMSMVAMRFNTNGSLDTSFDGDGKAFINVQPAGNRANSVVIQSDGRIVLGGSVTTGGVSSFAVARVNTDGSPDNSFNGTGGSVTSFATSSSILSIKLQSDGGIVATGSVGNGPHDIGLIRLTAGGTLDQSFDGDGKLQIDLGNEELSSSLDIQPDGKLIVAGQIFGTGLPHLSFLLMRFNSDGSPDLNFNGNGRVITQVSDGPDSAKAVAVLEDGRILAAGTSFAFDNDISLARFNSSGSLDTSLNGTGVEDLKRSNSNDSVTDTAFQSDGKIIALGYTHIGGYRTVAVKRYSADGQADQTFGTNGVAVYRPVFTTDTFDLSPSDVAIQPDGKIVVGAFSTTAKHTILRFNADGSLDTSFGTNGVLVTSILPNESSSNLTALILQSDGKILAAGSASSPTAFGASLIRLNNNGSFDSSFGSAGIVLVSPNNQGGEFDALALQTDGKIIATGQTNVNGAPSFLTARFNSDGSPDQSFGTNGVVITGIGSSFAVSTCALIQSDGRIVAAGFIDPGTIALVRYNGNGSLDQTFGIGGIVTVRPPPNRQVSLSDAVIQNQKFLIVGTAVTGESRDSMMLRLNSDGSPDNSFGTNGFFITDTRNENDEFSIATLLNGDKVLVGGYVSNGLNDDFLLARYDLGTGVRSPFDFDGDGKSDIGITRPNNGVTEWWISRSSDSNVFATVFGAAGDIAAPGDFTGDGKTDIAVFRPSTGFWFILRSEDFTFFAFPFGANGDIPMPADFDGDGKADPAVFRPSTSTWFIPLSGGGGTTIAQFGAAGDQPVAADYDGDGKADIAIYRNNNGAQEWWIQRSTAGLFATVFGATGDKAVPEDYTGDGKADVAVWRPSNGNWFVLRSEDFSFFAFPWGANGDIPAPGDYDGDGKTDAAVFRQSSATWFINRTGGQGPLITGFGAPTDSPVAGAYVR